MMATTDLAKFQKDISGVKEGKGQHDCLEGVNGLKLQDLATGYGRAIGVPELKDE